jgi:deoxyribodipyrimidine photo-lyase
MQADTPTPIIVWFRQDLRLADNPALAQAVASGRPVVALYILDEAGAGDWPMGGASRWWLRASLERLGHALAATGNSLTLRRGDARAVVPALAAETGAREVAWNRCYEPSAIARDKALVADLARAGVTATSFNAALLHEPWTIHRKAGTPFRVFTPFWRACQAMPPPEAPLPAPRRLFAMARPPASEPLASWNLPPTRPDWAGGLRRRWTPGEAGAVARLTRFIDEAVQRYQPARDHPALPGTSMLSPHLHFGEIGPRQIWHAVHHAAGRLPQIGPSAAQFLSEIGWREFSYHLLFHQPALPSRPLRAEFAAFPWIRDDTALAAWCHGRTGYPIVDAGMRELWATGWMHNRARMIAASFLVKDLMQDWRTGEAWYWDTLVDADLASNAASWQWVSGCGADAAPYFRVFNPVLQGRKFDPAGDYVRTWVPELRALGAAVIHDPWNHIDLCRQHGIEIGRDYPSPIVDHGRARERALSAFSALKR